MLQIVVEVAGRPTVCDADCSIFSQTVDRQRPPAAVWSLACQVELRGEDISCYLNNIRSVGLWKCLYMVTSWPTKRISAISQWKLCQRDGGGSQLALKLRHCHRMYCDVARESAERSIDSDNRQNWWSWDMRFLKYMSSGWQTSKHSDGNASQFAHAMNNGMCELRSICLLYTSPSPRD